jgi:hypothetical protein
MKLPENIIRRISEKALRLELLKVETSKFFLYFSGSCIPANESLFILLALPTLAKTVQNVNFSIVYLATESHNPRL